MSGLLIDYKNIIERNSLDLLLNKVSKPLKYKGKGNIGLILIISCKEYDIIKNLPKGGEKIKYLNTPKFINSIEYSYYNIYNKSKKMCELPTIIKTKLHLTSVCEILNSDLPPDVKIWSGNFDIIGSKYTDVNSIINNYIEQGFHSPYMTNISPLGNKSEKPMLSLYKENKPTSTDKKTIDNVRNESIYVSKQYKSNGRCSVKASIHPETVAYIKTLTNPKATLNKKGKLTQKECAGAFNINKIYRDKSGTSIFQLIIDKKSIMFGIEENVDAVWNRYNFHTHTLGCYQNHKVVNGWPSAQDYTGFVNLKGHTIIHIVVTIEGLYMISYSQTWQYKNKKINIDFVRKHYDINHEKNITPLEYVNKINNIKYEGEPIFYVQYLPWDRASETFTAFFAKSNDNCLATEKSVNLYNNFYK